MSVCPACNGTFRKGRRRLVLSPNGETAMRIVCVPCAVGRAIQIVPVSRAVPCAACTGPKRADATVCAGCANATAHRAVRAALAPFAEHLRGLARGYPNAMGAGLLMAADILDVARVTIERGAPDDVPFDLTPSTNAHEVLAAERAHGATLGACDESGASASGGPRT